MDHTKRPWERHVDFVQSSRLDAYLKAAVWKRARRAIGVVQAALSVLVVVSGLSAVVTLFADAAPWVSPLVTITTAFVSAFLQVVDLSAKRYVAADLARQWEEQARKWDAVWMEVLDGDRTGTADALVADQVARLSPLEHDVGLPEVPWLSTRLVRADQRRIVHTDALRA